MTEKPQSGPKVLRKNLRGKRTPFAARARAARREAKQPRRFSLHDPVFCKQARDFFNMSSRAAERKTKLILLPTLPKVSPWRFDPFNLPMLGEWRT